MLKQLISALVKSELGELKRRSAGAGLLVVAVLLLGLAAVFTVLGLYLWLSTMMLAWQAALVIVGLLSIAGLVSWLAGRSMVRRQRKRRDELDAFIQALLGRQQGQQDQNDHAGAPFTIAATAVIAGLIIGRRLSKKD